MTDERTEREKRPHCQAVTQTQWRHQQHWIKCCENRAQHRVEGIWLCGTHINKVGDLQFLMTMSDAL